MTGLVMLVAVLVATLLQVYLPGHSMFGMARCPFLMAVTLYYALCRSREAMAVSACLCGIMLDTASGIPLGFSCVCLLVLGAYVARFRGLVLVEEFVTQAFFGAVAAVVLNLAQFAYLRGSSLIDVSFGAALLKCLGAGVLGGLTTPLVFLILRALDGAVGVVHRRRDVEERFGDSFGEPA